MTDDTDQQVLDAFREMNRYDGRNDDWPSDVVYTEPRRTLSNYWQKFHAARDCGRDKLAFVEQNTHHSTSEKYEYKIRCWECGHEVPEDEILFIGGDWFSRHGWQHYGRALNNLWLPPERVLALGHDPDRDELEDALELTRIEREGSFLSPLGVSDPNDWRECEACGHDTPLLFDDRCRMCYDGEWTERMQNSLIAFERVVREHINDSFVHRLPRKVDPLAPTGTAYPGRILWRRHDMEGTSKLVEVTQRLKDEDDGHYEYVLWDPTHTNRWQYGEEDLAGCFWDTGLTNDEVKPVLDDRIRQVYQRVCDHSFHTVHDSETMEPDGEQCIHCRKKRHK